MPDSPTTRLGLYKSLSDGSETVNYTQDIGQNLDKLDTAAGFQIVTSGTRPAAPYSGKPIAESDTSYRTFFSNGTAPASASWVEIPNSSGTFAGDLRLSTGTDLIWNADTTLSRTAAARLALTGTNAAFGIGTAFLRPRLSGAAVTVANTTTETTLASYTIPASDAVIGASYRIEAWGSAGCTGTPTISFRPRLGGAAGTSIAPNTFTFASGVTGKRWRVSAAITCITTGGSGTWNGTITSWTSIPTSGANNTTPATTLCDGTASITRDTTTSQDFVLTVAWGTANAANTCTMDGYHALRIA